jgi:hypothetical protein
MGSLEEAAALIKSEFPGVLGEDIGRILDLIDHADWANLAIFARATALRLNSMSQIAETAAMIAYVGGSEQ